MKQKFKKGAASMYVVVIAALLFGVITVSFIRIIISNQLRSVNNELAQSAYDSALAGVEDTKTALIKYHKCLYEEGRSVPTSAPGTSDDGCSHVLYYIDNAINGGMDSLSEEERCRTVELALQRSSGDDDVQEVKIEQAVNDGSNTEQAYTCVTINNKLDDYRATLSSGLPTRVIPLKYAGNDPITGIKIAWYSAENGVNYSYGANSVTNYRFKDDYSTPPVISAQLIQTAASFTLNDFASNSGNNTDRGTLFLTPKNGGNNATMTHFDKNVLVKSNKHEQKNNPSMVNCKQRSENTKPDEEFACAATIELPNPVNADASQRNKDTFFLVVSLPYGNPSTDFAIQLCTDGDDFGDMVRGNCETTAKFDGAQTSVDSTGRANDMFSRVEARIELSDIYFPFAEFALQLTGNGEDDTLRKNFYVTKNCWGSECENSGVTN